MNVIVPWSTLLLLGDCKSAVLASPLGLPADETSPAFAQSARPLRRLVIYVCDFANKQDKLIETLLTFLLNWRSSLYDSAIETGWLSEGD